MSNLSERKKQLQKEMNEVEELEVKETIEKNYPIIKKKYEGKFFKYRNGYNADERWWLYTKVVEIKPSDVYDTNGNGVTAHFSGWTFQTDSYDKIEIAQEKHGYVHSLGKEITENEFVAAWNKMIDKMNHLK
jgi:hypothetical protein